MTLSFGQKKDYLGGVLVQRTTDVVDDNGEVKSCVLLQAWQLDRRSISIHKRYVWVCVKKFVNGMSRPESVAVVKEMRC